MSHLCCQSMSTLPQNILPDAIYVKWTKYLDSRNRGLKNESDEALLDAILSLESTDKESLQQFVFYLTDLQRTVDEKVDFRLFERIVLPCLVQGVTRNMPTYNRRLAQFEQKFHSSSSFFEVLKEKIQYTKEYFDPEDFYEKELEINPGDQVAVKGILERIAWQLNYSIHELPEYGLIGEWDDFESQLQKFKRYLNQSDTKDKWKKQLEAWQFVQETWKDYTANLSKYGTYADYLRANNLGMD